MLVIDGRKKNPKKIPIKIWNSILIFFTSFRLIWMIFYLLVNILFDGGIYYAYIAYVVDRFVFFFFLLPKPLMTLIPIDVIFCFRNVIFFSSIPKNGQCLRIDPSGKNIVDHSEWKNVQNYENTIIFYFVSNLKCTMKRKM